MNCSQKLSSKIQTSFKFLSRVTMVTREFGVGPFAQDSISCKISREVTKRQVTGSPNAVLVVHDLEIKCFLLTCVPVSFFAALGAI